MWDDTLGPIQIKPLNVFHYADSELVQRAMMNISNPLPSNQYRWSLVMDIFGFGSTMAKALCKRFNLDPDEIILGRESE